MARRRQEQQPAAAAEKSGYAHYERVAPAEVRFVEMCPGSSALCDRKDVGHNWYVPQAKLDELSARMLEDREDR